MAIGAICKASCVPHVYMTSPLPPPPPPPALSSFPRPSLPFPHTQPVFPIGLDSSRYALMVISFMYMASFVLSRATTLPVPCSPHSDAGFLHVPILKHSSFCSFLCFTLGIRKAAYTHSPPPPPFQCTYTGSISEDMMWRPCSNGSSDTGRAYSRQADHRLLPEHIRHLLYCGPEHGGGVPGPGRQS